MSEISLRQFLEHVAKRAEAVFKKQGNVTPMYHAVDAEGTSYLLAGPRGTKDEAVAQVRAFLKSCNAVRVAFMDEAWLLDSETTSCDDIDRLWQAGKAVSSHPDRIEAIMIRVEDATEGAMMGTLNIIRHGNRAVLGKLKIQHFDSAEGRMVGLLPTPPSTTKH